MNYPIARYSAPFRFGSKAAHHSLALLLCLFLLVESMARAFAPSPRLFAQGSAGPAPVVQGEKDARPLEPGKPIECEMAGGQGHDYRITLSAGQFMKVIVEQRGIDVVVGLLGPDAKQIMEFDSEIRSQGQETVWQVAEVAGSYRLNVKAKHKGEPAGGYEIRVVELRSATETDRVLQEARKLHTESQRLFRAGKYDESRPAAERALELREKALGPEHPDVAQSLHNLALIYRFKGDYAKAEPLFQRALAIWEKALGPEHPDIAESLNLLARLYEAKGDLTLAVTFQSRANEVSERNIALNLVTGSERQKLAYLATLMAQTDQIISLHARSAPDDSTARNLAATTILQRKGRVLDAMSDSIEALRRAASPQDRALFDQLKDIRSQQAGLVFGGLQRTTPAEYQNQIRNLAEQAEKLEDEISRRSVIFRAKYQSVTLAATQSAIPARAALIEFYSYHSFNAKSASPAEAFGQPRYVAYVLRQHGEAQWVDLGEAAPIDSAVTALRQALGSPNRADVKQLARALDEKVMRPVRKLVGDIRTLLLSPDGALNLIPFGALVDEQKRYLIESYSFTYLTSGRDLLRLQAHTPSQQGPVVVANPLFDLGNSAITNSQMADQRTESRRSIDFNRQSFYPLPGAEVEAKALGAILPEAKILTGAQATEAAIKQLRGPLILHVATHGFFLADRKSATPDRSGLGLEEGAAGLKQTQDALTENPLLRAGLILAGINQSQSGPGEDGVLTALEAAQLNLWGTKLVVLSACDTGLGEVKNGDGVYGLRRALALAGSESQVMSLWQVADKATRELMVGYYTGLQRGEGRSEALRNVQLHMLRSGDRRHPYYWAGFIQSGEWANLEGNR
jgi:CHAT domain-containing protein